MTNLSDDKVMKQLVNSYMALPLFSVEVGACSHWSSISSSSSIVIVIVIVIIYISLKKKSGVG